MSRPQKRYAIDLSALHAACESNYYRLLRLFPDYETRNFREFSLSRGGRVRVDVTRRCQYTTFLRLRQRGGPSRLLSPPRFDVRVYHDARMAEVEAFQGQRRVAARHGHPNPAMLARDEKLQQHLFLAEWLGHCLEQGCSGEGLAPRLCPAVAEP